MIELILEDRCTACGTCEEVCPTNVFDRDAEGRPVIARQAECHSCFLCEAHCPADALYVSPLRIPDPVTREHVLSLNVLGNFRRAVGFDRHEPGSYSYGEEVTDERGIMSLLVPPGASGADAAIYAAINVAERRGLVNVQDRKPIEREIVI